MITPAVYIGTPIIPSEPLYRDFTHKFLLQGELSDGF